jgi:hypothetical protein
MGEDMILPGGQPPVEAAAAAAAAVRWGWKKYVLGLPLGLVAGAGALLLGLDTPIGHRLIADALEGTDIGRGCAFRWRASKARSMARRGWKG